MPLLISVQVEGKKSFVYNIGLKHAVGIWNLIVGIL